MLIIGVGQKVSLLLFLLLQPTLKAPLLKSLTLNFIKYLFSNTALTTLTYFYLMVLFIGRSNPNALKIV